MGLFGVLPTKRPLPNWGGPHYLESYPITSSLIFHEYPMRHPVVSPWYISPFLLIIWYRLTSYPMLFPLYHHFSWFSHTCWWLLCWKPAAGLVTPGAGRALRSLPRSGTRNFPGGWRWKWPQADGYDAICSIVLWCTLWLSNVVMENHNF